MRWCGTPISASNEAAVEEDQVKVLYIAAECKPFSKVGGVGDVAGELAPAIRDQGIDIEIVDLSMLVATTMGLGD